MNTRIGTALICCLSITTGLWAQDPGQKGMALEDLITAMKAKEMAIKTASLEMETKGSFPGGIEFSTQGRIRVLGETHFHILVRSDFGPEMQVETETLLTPEGLYTREKDPVQGEIFTHMEMELLEELRAASQASGKESNLPGVSAGPSQGPLGSRVLEDLSAQFDLQVAGPVKVRDETCWVVAGPLRSDAEKDNFEGMSADRMDILVRQNDYALIRMTQLKEGKPISDVRITRLEIDVPIAAESFKLEVQPTQNPIDVMDHPPMREQILRVFADAEAKGWKRKAPESEGQAPSGEGKQDEGKGSEKNP
ncbi:MAG: hypothetical protein ACYTG5_03185 [Planctomycetota bacterium]|jgi:outer membrane lipoprotein-sorting protein